MFKYPQLNNMFILLEILCSIFLPPTRKMNFKTFKNITLTFTIFINQPVLKIGKLLHVLIYTSISHRASEVLQYYLGMRLINVNCQQKI